LTSAQAEFKPFPLTKASVPITQAGTDVNEGEVPLRMKYRQLLVVAPALALQAG
jgi:hypothetical protein